MSEFYLEFIYNNITIFIYLHWRLMILKCDAVNHTTILAGSTIGFGGGLRTSTHTMRFHINRIRAIVQKFLLNFMNLI